MTNREPEDERYRANRQAIRDQLVDAVNAAARRFHAPVVICEERNASWRIEIREGATVHD